MIATLFGSAVTYLAGSLLSKLCCGEIDILFEPHGLVH